MNEHARFHQCQYAPYPYRVGGLHYYYYHRKSVSTTEEELIERTVVNPGLPTNTMWGGICFHAAAYAMFCFTPRKGVWTVNREATQYTDFGFFVEGTERG
jgi:hypothetical protein